LLLNKELFFFVFLDLHQDQVHRHHHLENDTIREETADLEAGAEHAVQ
jgi:hypothetical protein